MSGSGFEREDLLAKTVNALSTKTSRTHLEDLILPDNFNDHMKLSEMKRDGEMS